MNPVVSFDKRKGSYSIGSSGLSFDYWYKTSDESINEDNPNTDSCSYKEVVVINEDCGMENWCSDEEETLQTYPETPMALSPGTAENWRHHNDDDDPSYNHGLLDITTEDDVIFTCDFTNNYQLVHNHI